ncbi:MAG: DUF2339 domain-containing protein [Jatrophihabitans sp.]
MTSSGTDPLPRLCDALTEVSARLRDISVELRTVQTVSALPPATAQLPPMPPPMSYYPAPFPLTAAYPAPPPPYGFQPNAPRPQQQGIGPAFPPPPSPRPQPSGPTFWERISKEGFGSRLLAYAGGAVTLAGVVLLLVLAIQRGYVGPLARVLLGAGLGAALIGIGLRLHRSPAGRIGAHAVAATGIAVLYLDVVAATSLYSFLPGWAGLIVGLVVAGAGVTVAARWDSQVLATFVVAGCAASSPILTSGYSTLLVGFLLVLQIATTPVQMARRWSILTLVASVPPVLAILFGVDLIGFGRGGPDARATALLCLTTALVQIVIATLTAAKRQADDLPIALLLAGPVPVLLTATIAGRYEALAYVGTVGLVLLAGWSAWRLGLLHVSERFATAGGAAGLVAGFEAACLAMTGDIRSIALLSGGILLAVLAERLRYLAALIGAAAFAGIGAILALYTVIQPRSLTRAPTVDVHLSRVATAGATGLLLAAAALAITWAFTRLHTGADPETERLVWTFGGLFALYGASSAVLCVGLAFSPDAQGFVVGHALMTVSWTIGALWLLLRHIDSTPLRVAGLALVAAALAKLVLFDLSSLTGIPRVLAFLGAGLVLLAAGARYATLVADQDESKKDRADVSART